MLLLMFGGAMWSFIAFLSRMECQASSSVFVTTPITYQYFQHYPNLLGDCEVYGVWPKMDFMKCACHIGVFMYPMSLWPVRVLLRVFLVRVLSDVRKHNHSLCIWSCTRLPWKPLSPSCLWLFKYVWDGANRLMGDLDVEILENISAFRGESLGVSWG